MEYKVLGKTEMEVSTLSLGCWALAGDAVWGTQDEADSIATVHASLEAGINLFDTAEMYSDGGSELILGRALKGRRHEAVIATKVRSDELAPVDLQRACEDSLRRLQTDYIDLYQIHWPSRTVPLADTWRAMERLVEQGKVRALGVCNFGLPDLADLQVLGRAESNQLPYSLLWRAIEHGIRQRCLDEGLGTLCYSPLQQGLLTGKYAAAEDYPGGRKRMRLFAARPGARHSEPGCEDEVFAALDRLRSICDGIGQPMGRVALAWLLQQPGMTSIIAGARTPDQVQRNVEALEIKLSAQTLADLAIATEGVKACVGLNPDPWQTESRFR